MTDLSKSPIAAVDGAALSVEEWRAVEVALRDAARPSASAAVGTGRLGRAWRWVTGFEPPRRLADPRLDAIRRFVLGLKRHGARASDMRGELRRLGLSAAQVSVLERAAS